MNLLLTKIGSVIPTPLHIISSFGRQTGKIFLAGFLFCSLLGIAIFYFFGYRFTQQEYVSTTRLQGVNRGMLVEILKQLQGQQSKAENAPSKDPFE